MKTLVSSLTIYLSVTMSRFFLSAACIFFALSVLMTGCDSGGGGGDAEQIFVQMQLDVNELPTLESGQNYRAWAVLPTRFLGSDLFNITEEGQYINSVGQFISNTFVFTDNIASATKIYISVEDKDGAPDAPSNTIVFAGDLTNGVQADLSVTHPDALGPDIDSASGVFSLLTPTDADDSNETEGVWFVESISAGNWAQGLDMPALPEGWTYEGWVEVADTVLSTGTFRDASAADDEAFYMTTQSSEFINFPGEDFLMSPPVGVTFPPDLSNSRVFVTIEPDPDGSARPYSIEVLSGSVTGAAQALTNYPLQSTFTAPSGSAMLR